MTITIAARHRSACYYAEDIETFVAADPAAVLGKLAASNQGSLQTTQLDAWTSQLGLLQQKLRGFSGRGRVYFEFIVPRLGKRIDVLALIDHVIFIFEFKVGEKSFARAAIEQVWDYALDLKNFHETSHAAIIAPILIATEANDAAFVVAHTVQRDGILLPVGVSPNQLVQVIEQVLSFTEGASIEPAAWEEGRYKPTPTIIEAATALYARHSVADLSRSDAGAKNLSLTSAAISRLIERAQAERRKGICFVTGVPGAGKTLVGLDIATKYMDASAELHSAYLSGNGPLVAILREALTRDRVARALANGEKIRKGEARKAIEAFIQNVHHFRDAYLRDTSAPDDHVVIFDEAQRAWTLEKTSDFMARKKGRPGFDQSEPEFLISCMDRHADWAVVVCLVGGGQEINTGEAGIGEWIRSLQKRFPEWLIHISPHLADAEYGAGELVEELRARPGVTFNPDLHLSVSMRSFRAEHVAAFVKHALDRNDKEAAEVLRRVCDRYPIVLTRELGAAKRWLRERARGSERYGMVVSSQAVRLKPHAIDVRAPLDPIHWFLDDREDVRSSYYLEDAATEFQVQGLELDWSCVVWDGDLRYTANGWDYREFRGNKWERINKTDRQNYLKNAYRVLLTRARQGMVIVVPEGDPQDPTRDADFYDPTYEYLSRLGVPSLS